MKEKTLEEIYEEWTDFYLRRIQKQTIDNYKAAWKHLRVLEKAVFSCLRTKDYQEVIDSCGTLSYSSLSKIKQLVKHLSDYGMMEDIIRVNYGSFIYLSPEQKKPKPIFSMEDIEKIKKYADNDISAYKETARITLILIFTGFRINELFSLEIKDVNLNEKYLIGGLKTKAGIKRIVPIYKIIEEYIVGFYRQNKELGYLLKSDLGKKLRTDKWRKYKFYPFMEELGFNTPNLPPKIKPHSTRHTAATLMNQAGMNPDILIKIIGHTDFSFTNSVYIHNNITELHKEMDKLDNILN